MTFCKTQGYFAEHWLLYRAYNTMTFVFWYCQKLAILKWHLWRIKSSMRNSENSQEWEWQCEGGILEVTRRVKMLCWFLLWMVMAVLFCCMSLGWHHSSVSNWIWRIKRILEDLVLHPQLQWTDSQYMRNLNYLRYIVFWVLVV